MTDQSESQSGPNREAPVSSAGFRPFGMIPMFNMVTTKFRGKDSDISLGEWKSNLQTTFALQGVPVDFRAELTLCCLEGKAKREILILAPEKRNSPELNFNELDKLYGDKTTASVLRSQFFNARQETHEDISSFALRLQEHFLRLKRKDPRGMNDEDILLRDHLVEGLRDTALRGEFRTKILMNDQLTFAEIKAELILREHVYGEMVDPVQCFAAKGERYKTCNAKDMEQIKSELWEDMNKQMTTQFNDLSQTLIKEIRSELHQATQGTLDWKQTDQSRSRKKGGSRPRVYSNSYDEQGSPICNTCSQPGHIARFCKSTPRSGSLN